MRPFVTRVAAFAMQDSVQHQFVSSMAWKSVLVQLRKNFVICAANRMECAHQHLAWLRYNHNNI